MRTARTTAAMLMLGISPVAFGQAAPGDAQAVPAPAAAPAQEEEQFGAGIAGEDEGAVDGEDIVVTGRAPPGSVPGDIAPEIQLNAGDIRAYGASSVAELLEELGPQVRSGRGRGEGAPVVLVNGRRTAGFQEIRDLPTEAILRVDILPEEVALRYGYRADQRVVNFVLRPRFRSYQAELDGSAPTAGGTGAVEVEGGLTRINRAGRLSVDLEYSHQANLLEADRGIVTPAGNRPFDLIGNIVSPAGGEIDPALSAIAGSPLDVAGVPANAAGGGAVLGDFARLPNATDLTPFRTLRPASDRFSANSVYSTTILGNVAATGTARFERSESAALLGLASGELALPASSPFSPFGTDVTVLRLVEGDPLERRTRSWTGNAGVALNGDVGRWRWSLNTSYDRAETETDTERGVDLAAFQSAIAAGDPAVDPFGPLSALGPLALRTDRARSVSSVGAIDALASGTAFELPAGSAGMSVRVLGRTSDYSGRSLRGGIEQSNAVARDSGTIRANIDLPIANAAREILAPLGRLSINANAELEQLSDFGTQTTLGYGLNWQPVTPVRLLVSVTHEEGAPTPQQLGDPLLATPNVRVFDFVRGETVDITRIDGGNPALVADHRRVFKAGLNVKPLSDADLTLSADYVSSRIENAASGFPAATAAIEAAFPERFVRDGEGRLVQFDNRPVNFARVERSELRWGINFSKPVVTERQRAMQRLREARQAERAAREEAATPGDGVTRGEGGRRRGGAGAEGPGAGRGAGGPGGGFRGRGGFGGGGGGRLQAGLYHTWSLSDSILIRPGLPELDLLDGGAIGSRGGQPRHEVEFRGGYTRDGIGGRLNVDWQSATRVDGGVAGGETLNFGSLATVGLRLFADLGQQPALVRDRPWLRGTRVTLAINNVFDQRQRVTDATGTVPLNFQPGFIDPIGRSVRLSVRKLFF